MCVIFIADDKRPTSEMVEAAYSTNPEGGGIAWREKGLVKWKKGLTVEEMVEACAEKPLPYIVHFRISSCGGTRLALCHPFPISKEVPLDLEGSTKDFVLFHNGHWKDWKEDIKSSVINNNFRLPLGKWSDSRAMAWMAGHYGVPILEMIDEKAVAFGPKEIEVFGTGWVKVDHPDGDFFWASNKHWEHKGWPGWRNTGRDSRATGNADAWDHSSPYTTPPASMVPSRIPPSNNNGQSGGTVCETPFRGGVPKLPMGATEEQGRKNEQQEAKEVPAGVREGTGGAETKQIAEGPDVVDKTLIPKEDLEMFKWARSINVKKLSTNTTPENRDRLNRLEELKKGNQIVGPISILLALAVGLLRGY